MSDCHSVSTSTDSRAKLSEMDSALVADPTKYRILARALQYLTHTRPDLAYAVQQVYLYMHDPRELHLALLKRILLYVKGSIGYGLHLGTSTLTTLMTYFDVD
ncbi:uncharacterized mitochondrial protein AtMg00810-like [Phragmites australis]|uniref:uncharacterized mitochondrial protein AtMg00810-like n=1 Tax=Phragmites australis TaxID=29695 RepID=UPI002D78917C|nr:uncharacterized mitochondrial protein AtMg00810-like [Phragmites australis]